MTSFPLGERRADNVLRVLRERLSKDDAAAGSRLPPERELAAQLNVSRRVLREALEILEQERLIERVPGRGTIVLGSESLSGLSNVSDVRQYTSPLELMDARFALEPAIAAMAALHATSHDIDKMHHCIERSKAVSGDAASWEKWDSAFHRAVGEATHNQILTHFFMTLIAARAQTAWGKLRRASLTAERQALYIQQHSQICAAIQERDPEEAQRIMRAHLTTVRRTMLHRLDDL